MYLIEYNTINDKYETPICFGTGLPSSGRFLELKITNPTRPYMYTSILLLLTQRYNLYKVLACSTTFFQLSPFCATFFQLLMFMLFISSKTSSSQRVLGLPIGLLDMGFHLLIFCTILSSAMRSTWPNQFNLCFFLINPIIPCPFNISFIS